MDVALLAMLAACAVLVAVGLGAALVGAASARRRMQADLGATRAELAALRTRVDELVATAPSMAGADGPGPVDEFVITTLATPPASEPEPARPSGAEFLAVAAGESLVRVVSLGHGVRRALSAENRHRIRFEMRREVKRSRKRRRRDLRAAQRHTGSRAPADLTEDAA
jgi:hypothetical protein